MNEAAFEDVLRGMHSWPAGAVLRVARPAHGFVWEGSLGPFGGEAGRPIAPADGFRTASITKSFTSAALFLLAEQGKVDLSAPALTWLPAGSLDGLQALATHGSLTLMHLLNHTSGIYDYASDPQFATAVARAPAREWAPGELLALARRLGQPYCAPGAGQHYSDTGYVLLGMVIEAVTGCTLAHAYRTLLLDRLGLVHTALEGRGSAPQPVPLSHPYAADGSDTRHYHPSFDTFGGGGLVSTAGDLAAFAEALFGQRLFEQAATLAAMMRIPDAQLHWQRYEACGLYRITAGIYDFWGHFGHWGAFMLHQRELGVTITGTANIAQGENGRATLATKLQLEQLCHLVQLETGTA